MRWQILNCLYILIEFVISKIDHENIIQKHMERIEKLAKKPKLYNPVFVKLDDEGKLVVE